MVALFPSSEVTFFKCRPKKKKRTLYSWEETDHSKQDIKQEKLKKKVLEFGRSI